MEQPPLNMPVMEPKPKIAGWFQVWMTAITKPNERTFVDLAESPNATSKTAYLWIFIAGTISGILSAILQTIYTATGTTPQLPIPGLEQYMPSGGGDAGSVGITLVVTLCVSPFVGVIYTLFFAISVAIVQWIAKLFGGVGTYNKLLYAFAAVAMPFTLVSGVFMLLGAIPYIGFCLSILSFGLGIYAFVLQVMAVKGVNRFGWGAAIGSVFIPGLVVFIFCCFIVIAGLTLLAPVIGDVFNNFQFAP